MAMLDFNTPGGLLNLNPSNTGSLGINLSPINEQKKIDEQKRKRAEESKKLQDFADLLRMINANQSGNAQEAAMFSNRMAQRKAEQEARQLKAQQDMKRRNIYNNAPQNVQVVMDYADAGIPAQVINSLVSTPKDNSTSLMQNAQALADLRKRYSDMSEVERESLEGKLLAQQINDFAGLGGALKYDPFTAYSKSSAETAGEQGVSFGEGPLTKGEVSADEKFGTFYVNYIEKGRGAKNIANAERLEDAEFIMKYAAQNGIGISGVPAGIIANRPTLSAFFNPEGVMSQERVASVIQQSLKEILGGQFTEKEGIALIQRGYNPSLSPEENLERLLDLKAQVDQIIESEQTAVDYYENNNKSLRGFKGKRYTKEDFNRDLVKDYTMDVIDLSDQALKDAYMIANEDSLWIKTLEKEINRRADKKR